MMLRSDITSVIVIVQLLVLATSYVYSSRCTTCEEIVNKFQEGIKKTSKSNFGGGNTNWEEKSLGSYTFSETRLLEILETVCGEDKEKDSDKRKSQLDQCHVLLEEQEESIENWWFKHFSKGKDTSLRTYLCVERVRKACCEYSKWGPTCSECSTCVGQATCDGNGTREGTGKCNCNVGYKGDRCQECSDSYYQVTETPLECQVCHSSCEDSCSGPEASQCDSCKTGWKHREGMGCQDVNECENDPPPCSNDHFCVNNEGSYNCTKCHRACASCTNAGEDNCVECTSKHYKDGNTCKQCDRSCANSCTDGTPKTCDACAEGYELKDGLKEGCVDINECLVAGDTKLCPDGEYCVNFPGTQKCLRCNDACKTCFGAGPAHCHDCAEGFAFAVDEVCRDIDECTTANPCKTDAHQACENTRGSYKCKCDKGYKMVNGECVDKAVKEDTEKKPRKKQMYKGPANCEICQKIVEKIHKGINDTKKTNFGGGNTKWEEAKLGSYLKSETRLTEILEKVCGDLGTSDANKCHHLLEVHEDTLEYWWFKVFSKGKTVDLYNWLCIQQVQICCPNGTFGMNCTPCPGGWENPCNAKGECLGSGTRGGEGICRCDDYYAGDDCTKCAYNGYNASENNSLLICEACDSSCGTYGCQGPGSKGCRDCTSGYIMDTEQGCIDVNECENNESICDTAQYCSNTVGSYKCVDCSRACDGCTGEGESACKQCNQRYYRNEQNTCTACSGACKGTCTGGLPEHCVGGCEFGFELLQPEGCRDINECQEERPRCGWNQYCVNIPGGFQCEYCDSACSGCTDAGSGSCTDCAQGYAKEDSACTDVDECSVHRPCTADNEVCVNSVGSYTCECETNFIRVDKKCIIDPAYTGVKVAASSSENGEQHSQEFSKEEALKRLNERLKQDGGEFPDLTMDDLREPQDSNIVLEGKIPMKRDDQKQEL